jgi:hypothetical protein
MKKIKIPKAGTKLARAPKIGKIPMGKTGGGRSAGMAMPKLGGTGRKKKGMFG